MAKKLNRDAFNDWVYDRIDDYSHRIEVYYGGAGSGKSFGAFQKVLLKAVNDKRKVLIVRKTGTYIRDSTWALMLKVLVESGLYSSSYVNKSNFEIALYNGSKFLFKGLDDSEKMKSIVDLTDIIIEEATEISEEDFIQLDLRLRPPEDVKNPQIYLMYNPVSKTNWVFKRFHEGELADDETVIKTNYMDNKFLAQRYLDKLNRLKETNKAFYRIYALGEFATLDKLVYPNREIKLISDEEVRRFPLFAGLDFGYTNDPSALIWGRYDKAGNSIYITGEYYKKGLMNNELADAIISLGMSKEVIIADSQEPKSIAELNQLYGIRRIKPARKGQDSVINGISFIQMHHIYIDERCINTIEEFDNYTWEKDRKNPSEYTNKPIDAFNHCLDALRYGLEPYMQPEKALKPINVLKPW